jgi:hypothetical protein
MNTVSQQNELAKAQNNTTKALELLIESSQIAQQYYADKLKYQNNYQFYKEFCTIKMSTTRGLGHTQAIINTSIKYFNKILILTPTLDISEQTKNKFSYIPNIKITKKHTLNSLDIKPITTDLIETNNKQFHFGSLHTINNFRGYDLEAVYVDVACMMKDNQEKDIYTTLAPCMHNYPYKYFIFIQ